MRTVLTRGSRLFATATTTATKAAIFLPRYYPNVALDQGPDYYDYANYRLNFGYHQRIAHVYRNQDDYEIIRRLGAGRYSGVFEGVNIVDQKRVTIKILRKGTPAGASRSQNRED